MNCSGPNGSDYRVIQLHPTRRCNLACLHCYSSSSPQSADILSPQVLSRALEVLSEEGFNVVSISGGEPLLYKPLFEVLRFARSLGMTVTLTTNGMLLNEALLGQLAETAHLLAISLDGVPASHNRMRNHPQAFEKMARNVKLVRDAKIPFGFIFALTLYNLDELAWVARFATEQGAALLQVHPLEEEGRAGQELQGAAPDEEELAHAFVEVARLQALYSGKLVIQFDAADRQSLVADPSRAFAMSPAAGSAGLPLGSLAAPLVLEHDGALTPFQYGVSRDYCIADASRPDFRNQIASWKTEGYPKLLDLCSRVYAHTMDPRQYRYPFFNWYSAVLRGSKQEQLVQIA
jgi:sulfatase maturation enzyme AslB (radical SAM superfamily)